MSTKELLNTLRSLDIKLWLEGEDLLFDAPKGVMTSEIMASIRERKSEIISLLKQINRKPEIPFKPILRNQKIPLSFAQERLWFLDQFEKVNATYNIAGTWQFLGQLNLNALRQAIREIIRRHEVLRTTFESENGVPFQIIHSAEDITFPVIDLQHLTESEQRIEVQRLAVEEAQKPFDLSCDSLIRITLLKQNPQSHVLLLTIHHIVFDGWSLGIFFQELETLYQAFLNEQASPLPELPIQYADFAVWQRQWLTGEVLANQLNYWREQLTGIANLSELPTDRPRPPVQTFNGCIAKFTLNKELTQKLNALSQKAGVTLFMTLFTAFSILLHRYTSQEDIVVGTGIANRNRKEIEPLIGFFVNMLALRINFQENPQFSELLTQVQKTALEAYAHQDLPFEKLVEELQPERSTSYSPLFQVAFLLQNAPLETLKLPDLTIKSIEKEYIKARLDLTVMAWEKDDGIQLWWEYNSDLFDATTINRMVGHFEQILEGIVANPYQSISTLPLLTEAQRNQLLVEWNNTATDYPQDKCIHQLFEEQVAKTPDTVAVIFEDEQLTYQQLNERANQLARYLQSLGITTETLVGICLEPSSEMIVGLLAILKAGGAYLPLDSNYPSERLEFMVADAQVPVLLTKQTLMEKLSFPGINLVCIDSDGQDIQLQDVENLPSTTNCDNLAYVIYTSGSTGIPKGVTIPHKAVNRLVLNSNYIQLTSSDRIVQASNVSFDAATFEIWGALLNGATLTSIKKEILLSPPDLVSYLQKYQITTLFITTALFNQIATVVPQAFKSLRYLLFGGEAVNPQWVRAILTSGAPENLIHVYGPTENTTFSSWYLIKQVGEEATTIPIGTPISNTQIYVLDQKLNPVPIGVPGELYLGGDGLAKGYLNQPDLTVQRFIAKPFEGEGAKLYKTGDQARYLADGNLEFLGRFDHQVKIRGFRIEPGEIEFYLSQHPAVKETVVIATGEKLNEKRIVAYVVPYQQQAVEIKNLRRFLRERLPEYMIPNAFMLLDVFPLTPNGKVDRKALPEPNFEANREHEFIAPRNQMETSLAQIWQEVLGMEKIGINDNFFALGGHSLLGTQVFSRIRQTLDLDLPLTYLFEFPTIAELSYQIETIQQLPQQGSEAILDGELAQAKAGNGAVVNKIDKNLISINPVSRDRKLPLSFAQERLWFLDQLEGINAIYNIPGACQLSGELNLSALRQAITEIIRRHEVLRTTFDSENGIPYQIIGSNEDMNFTVIDLQHLRESQQAAEVKRLALQEVQKPFNLSRDFLMRITLVKQNPKSHVLLLTIHHIIFDGWSLGIFFQELETLYQAFLQEQASPLSELSIQYADFAVWQREWLTEEIIAKQMSYWKQQLAGIPPLLELPYDYPRPPIQTFRGSAERFNLGKELTQKLNSLTQKSGTTLFMTLLTAFNILLYRYSQQEDIVIGSPIANRNYSEIEPLMGFFVNNLVLRSRIKGKLSFEELLTQVKQVCLDAYAHQNLPFEKLVDELKPERNLGHSPLFQVMFTLQNIPLEQLQLSGLTITPITLERVVAQFDLTLSIRETATGLTGDWEYNTDLFAKETIQNMSRHFCTLLEAIVDNPQQTLDELPLLSIREREEILLELNHTQTDYPQDKCIHQLFEEQVERTPEAIAAVDQEQQFTYRELNARANQLARYLKSLGVKSEDLVGICVERSLDMLVGLFGILKAGGAYVPIAPDYPQKRFQYLLSDSQVAILLTQEKLLPKLPETQASIICLDRELALIAAESDQNLAIESHSNNLAYVIYTSGSTGKPKGVLIEHRSLVNFTQATICEYQLTGNDRVLQFATISFDTAAEEIYGCLLSGGTLVLRNEQILAGISQFCETCEQLNLSVLDLPTAYWQEITSELDSLNLNFPASVRLVIIGGEKASTESVKTWQERFGNYPQLINTYGPTETTVVATLCRIDSSTTIERNVPIGLPIANTQCYILDKNLQPLPKGVPGELYIGGVGLARGYLNRPELTQEKFIPHPFEEKKGSRLYKTGDLVRYLWDGNIEYLGRLDNQAKIRGFRIELGEIETTLHQQSQVKAAVVVVKENDQGDKRLIAYLVPYEQQTIEITEIRSFLEERLPEYMIPLAFVILECLPLNPHGKVDRQALSLADYGLEDAQHDFIAAHTPQEQILVNIWQEVLNMQPIGINDNFFELGGDSILSLRIVARANQAGLKLTTKQLFEYQTIAELVTVIESTTDFTREEELVTGSVFLTPIQQEFFAQNPTEPNHFNQSFLLEVSPALKPEQLEQIVHKWLEHHDALRMRFSFTEQGWQQEHEKISEKIPLSYIDLSELEPQKQHLEIERIANQMQKSLDLFKGELLRVVLFNLGTEKPGRLLIIIHHLVVDGVSWGILLEDLYDIYEQLQQGKPINLPSKTTSFQKWSQQLQNYSQSPQLRENLEYWLGQSGVKISPFPVDYPNRQKYYTMGSLGDVFVTLNQEQTQALLQKVPSAYNTKINDVLLTALAKSLGDWTGQKTLLIDLESHGREDLFEEVNLSRTVGWFTSIFPVFLTLESDRPGEMLKSIKEQLRKVPQGGISYGVGRYLTHNQEIQTQILGLPQAEICFNYLGQLDSTLSKFPVLGKAPESSGKQWSDLTPCTYLLEINSVIITGSLQMRWTYNKQVHQESTIKHLAQEFIRTLEVLIEHCQFSETQGYTSSDFPLANLNDQELDQISQLFDSD